jgi:sulfate-transporting ATPase
MQMRYGGLVAVEDLSLTVSAGEVVGLIGPNGAGKTTAMDGITGLTKIVGGTITYNELPVNSWSPVKRARAGISRSFQSLELFEDMTVLENLQAASDHRRFYAYFTDLFLPRKHRLPEYVRACVDEFDLGDDLHRPLNDLPYSKRRLLAIARAVATKPSILLLDEPASGLSDTESRELAELVRILADKWGMGILLVEHDMDLVMQVCDRICVLDFGKTIAQGTPAQVRTDPSVIAAYLGAAETGKPGSEEGGA